MKKVMKVKNANQHKEIILKTLLTVTAISRPVKSHNGTRTETIQNHREISPNLNNLKMKDRILSPIIRYTEFFPFE